MKLFENFILKSKKLHLFFTMDYTLDPSVPSDILSMLQVVHLSLFFP